MGLEAGTYISDLVATNPVHATDSVGEGDDHLRLIKSCLLNTLPGLTGAMTLTHTQLNSAAIKSEANTFTDTVTVDGGNLHVYSGGLFRLYDTDESAWVSFQHDGTDLDITGNSTTSITLTGVTDIAAGTVDADFDALTATSYGGITEANLVDKSASETISGATWAFQAITATSFGGIASANLLDKSATETVSGAWTFSSTLNGKDPDQFAEEDTALTASNTDAAQPGFKGCPVNTQNGNYNFVLGDAGKIVRKTSGGSGETYTVPANSSVAFPVGTILIIHNDGGGTLSIAITTDTMEQWVSGSTGTRTLADNGRAVIEKVTTTSWKISGLGLS